MTRDEAIKAYAVGCGALGAASGGKHLASVFGPTIDGLVALGLLKLDEPVSAYGKLCDKLADDFGWSRSSGKMTEIYLSLERSGLKLVEA